MTERHRMTRGGGQPLDLTDPERYDPAELAAAIPRNGSPGYTGKPVEGDTNDPTELAARIPRRP
jgi:hypothetical protein